MLYRRYRNSEKLVSSPHKLLVLSSKFCNLYFFTGAVQRGIFYLIFDLGVSGCKDAVFTLCAVCKYKTNTSSLLKTSPMTLTCNRSVAIYVSPVVHMLGTLQLMGTSQSTLECPWSTGRFPVSSWRCKVSETGLCWSNTAPKTAETCIAHSVHLISLHGFLAYLQVLLSTSAIVKAGGLFLPQDLE